MGGFDGNKLKQWQEVMERELGLRDFCGGKRSEMTWRPLAWEPGGEL